jgi:Skp family chaperone for outer membrane proteins
MPQPPWFVRLGHGKLMLSWMVGVGLLAAVISATAADLQTRPAEVVTETVRVREIVTEHHTAAELEAERARLRRLRRELDQRRERLAALRRSLDARAEALDAREDEVATGG